MSVVDDCHLLIDKYRPQSINDIKFNTEVAKKLISCSKVNDIPHLIIKGPNGSGKKLFADLYIQTKYGKDKLSIKQQKLEIKHASKTIELNLIYSQFHYKIDPSAHGVYDRLIIQGFIKDILQAKPISPEIPYHIIIIENADKLTLEAQQSLRRTLEKFIDNCRFIFILNHESTLIEPLMSRCVQLRLCAPTNIEINGILNDICQKEKFDYKSSQIEQISTYSKRNLNVAINLLQYFSIANKSILNKESIINFTDHVEIDNFLNQIVDVLFTKKQPKSIIIIRTHLYDLLVHCVDPLDIMKQLFQIIFKRMEDDKSRHQLIQILSKYENTLKQGSKPIYHLEGFIVSTMNIVGGHPHVPRG